MWGIGNPSIKYNYLPACIKKASENTNANARLRYGESKFHMHVVILVVWFFPLWNCCARESMSDTLPLLLCRHFHWVQWIDCPIQYNYLLWCAYVSKVLDILYCIDCHPFDFTRSRKRMRGKKWNKEFTKRKQRKRILFSIT